MYLLPILLRDDLLDELYNATLFFKIKQNTWDGYIAYNS